jgi:molybdenum-dependent DNA-binding transcriptional regulator ModE
MSAKDRDRLKVLHEVNRRHITQGQAGRELGVSSRWVRALLQRMKQEGDRAVVHRLRGRSSNRKLPVTLKRRVLELFAEQKRAKQWHDYGPTPGRRRAGPRLPTGGQQGNFAAMAD